MLRIDDHGRHKIRLARDDAGPIVIPVIVPGQGDIMAA